MFIHAIIIILVIILLFVILFSSRTLIITQVLLYKLKSASFGDLIIKSSDGKDIIRVQKTSFPKAIVYVKDFSMFCKDIFLKGEVGIGEMYMDAIWSSPTLVEFIQWLIINFADKRTQKASKFSFDDKLNIKHHYDVGNDFYQTFLTDDLMAYTCGFFFNEKDTLNDAQYNKVNTIIRKLALKEGERVLDVGCGWGKIANYVSVSTKTNVSGVTLSDEQAKFINENHKHIEVYNKNFLHMDTTNKYDKIYSIGIMEHIRCPNYIAFFEKMFNLLEPSGRLVLHTITFGENAHISTCDTQNEIFVTKYIFPGGQIPKREWIVDAAGKNRLKLVHMEVFGGQHYAKTLRHWRENMLSKKDQIISMGYNEHLIRMYEYYFASCEAGFLSDKLNLTHFVFDKVNDLSQSNFTYNCVK